MKERLTRKIGPFPAYVWLGLVGVAALVYRHFRPAAAPAADTGASTNGGSDLAAGAAGAGGGGAGLTPPDQALPVPPADLGNGGTPVIFDPLTGTTTDYGQTDTGGMYPPYGRDLPQQPLLGEAALRQLPNAPAPLPAAAVAARKRVKAAGRPASSGGRTTPRAGKKIHVPAKATPKRKVVPKLVVHAKAPPIAPPKKKKAVLRATAQQAHNHGEPAPARARSTAAAGPTRTTQSVSVQAPTPARALPPYGHGTAAPPLPSLPSYGHKA